MIDFAEEEKQALHAADPEDQPERYVEYVTKVVDAFEDGQISGTEAGKLLHHAETRETQRHPMLREISFMGCDLEDEGEPGKASREEYWQTIKQVLQDYKKGNLYPANWILFVNYAEKQDGKIIHSNSSRVYREDKEVVIETGNESIAAVLEQAVSETDDKDADQDFLKSVGDKLPEKINDLELDYRSLVEHLKEPLRHSSTF